MCRRARFLLRFALPLTVAAVVAGVPAEAQRETGGESDDRPLFVEQVDVSVVNVEVFVVDRRGRRVTGLTKDDFEILQDGEPVPISNFFAVAREDWVGRAAEEASERREAVAPASDLPEEQQLNLLVYVDHFNLHSQNRKRALDELKGFLEDRMFLGDRVMLMGYDGQLEVVQPFTRNWAEVAEGLRRMGRVKAMRPVDDAERRRALAQIRLAADEDDPEMALQFVRSYIQEEKAELRRSTRALEQTVRGMAGLPGRKALLYVSDGLARRPGEELYQYMADVFGDTTLSFGEDRSQFVDTSIESVNQDEAQVFNAITREANANQVTFYTVDARGGAGETGFGADFDSTLVEGGGRVALEALRTLNYQEPLIEMAQATGGTSILNTYELSDAFYRAGVDFDHFYSLGFQAPSAGDAGYHDIEVRVKRPGLQARHRRGYVDKPAPQRMADRTLSSLIFEMESNPLGVSMTFGEPEPQGRRELHVPMLVRIPFSDVTLLPNGDVQQGRLRIFVVVKDEKGGLSDTFETTYPVEVPTDRLPDTRGKEIGYGTMLKMSPGTPRVAVGVWDELSGEESFIHTAVRVERPKRR